MWAEYGTRSEAYQYIQGEINCLETQVNSREGSSPSCESSGEIQEGDQLILTSSGIRRVDALGETTEHWRCDSALRVSEP